MPNTLYFSYLQHESTAEIQVCEQFAWTRRVTTFYHSLCLLQSATINWTSPLSSRTAAGKDDVVKVEVWDVVDRAIKVDKVTSERVAAEMVYNLTGEGTELCMW